MSKDNDSKELVEVGSNPFHGQPSNSGIRGGVVAIEQTRAVAEVQVKLITAAQRPRDAEAAYQQVINSCKRLTFADKAMYSFPRGNTTVSGASIRLAEEMARAWGNVSFGIQELSRIDGDGTEKNPGYSEMRAYAWDLEKNTDSFQNFTVKHLVNLKGGKVKVLTDERDIYELCANQGGRRLRARILAILPPDLVEGAVAQVKVTLTGGADMPIADRIRKLLDYFDRHGISKKHIEARLGKPVVEMLPEELAEYHGIYMAIRANQSSPSDFSQHLR